MFVVDDEADEDIDDENDEEPALLLTALLALVVELTAVNDGSIRVSFNLLPPTFGLLLLLVLLLILAPPLDLVSTSFLRIFLRLRFLNRSNS